MENPLALLDGAKLPDQNPAPLGYTDDEGNGLGLDTLVAYFEDAEEATETARKAAERDRDYYDGRQLTAAELKELQRRGQPDVIINRIQPKINFLMGYEAQNRTDPRAFPRTPQDEQAAEAATDALRYVKDASELDTAFSQVWENMLIEGLGGVELVVEQGQNGETKIEAVSWDWDRLFYDPYSRKPDFSDARYLGGVIWMDAEDAKRRWPQQEGAESNPIDVTLQEATLSRTYDDRPTWKKWTSGGKRKRVRIVQMYYRKPNGTWHYCVYTKGGKLDSYDVPFVDQDGQSWCPLIMQSAYVDRDNNRYGLVRLMIGVQDEINKRRSKALHRLTMRQVVTERGAVEDEDATKVELSKPDGMIVVNPGFRFEMLGAAEQLAAELQLLQEAKTEIELMGPNAALLGKDDSAPSGRAILANQSSGQTEIGFLLDRHRHLKKRCYQRIWDLIRQYKTEEWWVRVTDNEDNIKFVGLNKPVKMFEEIGARLEKEGMPPEEIAQRLKMMAADPMVGPQLEQVARVENQPTQMYMDVTIEEVPDTANVQMEQFDALVKLAPAVTFPPQVYLKASSLRNKKELLDELNGGQDPMAAQMQAKAGQLQLAEQEAKVQKLLAETRKINVEADMAQTPLGIINEPAIAPAEQISTESAPPAVMGDQTAIAPPAQTGV
jgi:hypothetical protein